MKKHIFFYISIMQLIFCFISYSYNKTPEEFYYEAVDFELKARTNDEFVKLINIYEKVLSIDSNYPNRELLASSLFAIADIYIKKLNDKNKASSILKQLVQRFPYTSWKNEAEKTLKKLNYSQIQNEPDSDLVFKDRPSETKINSQNNNNTLISQDNSIETMKSSEEALTLFSECIYRSSSLKKEDPIENYSIKTTLESKGKNHSLLLYVTPEAQYISLNGILYSNKYQNQTIYFPKENKIYTAIPNNNSSKLDSLQKSLYTTAKLLGDFRNIRNSIKTNNIYRINSQEDFFTTIDIFPEKGDNYTGQMAIHNELYKFFNLTIFFKGNEEPAGHFNIDEFKTNIDIDLSRWKYPDSAEIADSIPHHYDCPESFIKEKKWN